MILLREGRKTPQADYPLEYNFTEGLPSMPHSPGAFVPGPGDSEVDMAGNRLDKAKYLKMLKEYYALRGWDENGVPKEVTLKKLGMEDILAEAEYR
jgi:aldehyde:ferredoxin oxidoreductase